MPKTKICIAKVSAGADEIFGYMEFKPSHLLETYNNKNILTGELSITNQNQKPVATIRFTSRGISLQMPDRLNIPIEHPLSRKDVVVYSDINAAGVMTGIAHIALSNPGDGHKIADAISKALQGVTQQQIGSVIPDDYEPGKDGGAFFSRN